MLSTVDFFAAFDRAGMLKEAAWTPSVGLPGAGVEQKEKGRFRAPATEVLAGEAFTSDITFQYPALLFPGLKRGEVLAIAGTNYKLREDPRPELDGSRYLALLESA